jgi:hypothetical protein
MSMNKSTATSRGSVLGPTKVFFTLGVLLVIAGLSLEGWHKLTANDDRTVITVGGHQRSLPGLHLIMPGVTVILVLAVVVSIVVLARGKRHSR